MFRPGGSAKGRAANSSDSESDWDTTTADFPTPRHTADGGDMAQDSGSEHVPAQPTPKTRGSLTGKGDKKQVETPRSGQQEDAGPFNSRKNTKTPASASGVHLSPLDSGSRSASPVPPYTSGFRDALRNGEDSGRRDSPALSARDQKGNKYGATPQNRIPADDSVIPEWEDSDAEQQTLRELHTTLKKEKTRESESKAAQKQQVQDDGDGNSVAGRTQSTLEKWMQGKEDKKRQKNMQEMVRQEATTSQARKTGMSAAPPQWSEMSHYNDSALALRADASYQSFVVKDPSGRRYLYFFNEGNMAFYEVEEEESTAVMPNIADKVEKYIKRGWQEFFGVLRIVTSFAVLLMVEAVKYIINHIARPIFLGVVLTTGDQLFKPVLAGLFNFILQPFIIFSWNLMSGIRHVLQPAIDILGGVMTKCAILLQAVRLVEVNLGSDYLQNRRALDGSRHGGIEVV